MSFKTEKTYPCNPLTNRGYSTKLTSNGDKIVYTNGRTVVIRDLASSAFGVTYTQHVKPATVASISPSGYYCASADTAGNVRVWDIAGTDQILKRETRALSTKINDIAWDGDSQRIIAVGEGREKFGTAFNMESGNSVGDISGHSRVINAVSIRQQRPFRAVTASDDGTVIFYTGVPYQYSSTIKDHTRFVQDVKFSPSGDTFASVGSDMKAFLYNGQTGEALGELAGAHKGSIMACAWSPDSKNLLTSSMDRAVKLWDVETRQAVTAWTLGTGVEHQQVGNTWAGSDNLVSLSLSGVLNVFDKREGSKPSRTLYGPGQPISTLVSPSTGTFFAGTNDGRVTSFTTADGAQPVSGDNHATQVVALAATEDKIYSVGFDDTVREVDVTANKFSTLSVGTSGQPKAVAVSGSTVFVASTNGVQVFEGGKELYKLPVNNPATAISVHGKIVAVGSEDKSIKLYEWDGSGLKETGRLSSNNGAITALAFTPDGASIAAGDSAGKVIVYNVAEKTVITSRWAFHSARIYAIAWTSDGKHCASGSLDTHVYIYSVETPSRNVAIKNAHANGVTGVAWVEPGVLASAGADGCVRTWSVTVP